MLHILFRWLWCWFFICHVHLTYVHGLLVPRPILTTSYRIFLSGHGLLVPRPILITSYRIFLSGHGLLVPRPIRPWFYPLPLDIVLSCLVMVYGLLVPRPILSTSISYSYLVWSWFTCSTSHSIHFISYYLIWSWFTCSTSHSIHFVYLVWSWFTCSIPFYPLDILSCLVWSWFTCSLFRPIHIVSTWYRIILSGHGLLVPRPILSTSLSYYFLSGRIMVYGLLVPRPILSTSYRILLSGHGLLVPRPIMSTWYRIISWFTTSHSIHLISYSCLHLVMVYLFHVPFYPLRIILSGNMFHVFYPLLLLSGLVMVYLFHVPFYPLHPIGLLVPRPLDIVLSCLVMVYLFHVPFYPLDIVYLVWSWFTCSTSHTIHLISYYLVWSWFTCSTSHTIHLISYYLIWSWFTCSTSHSIHFISYSLVWSWFTCSTSDSIHFISYSLVWSERVLVLNVYSCTLVLHYWTPNDISLSEILTPCMAVHLTHYNVFLWSSVITC